MRPVIRLLSALFCITVLKAFYISLIQKTVLVNSPKRVSSNLFGHAAPLAWPITTLERVRTFRENSVHFTMKKDAEWEALIPGNGLVYLGEQRMPYMLSMFHQLRCINIIRREIVALADTGRVEPAPPSNLSRHCVNYLRQMIMCRGDLDLDIVMGSSHPEVHPDTTECVDWEVVYQEVEKNQAMTFQN